MSDQGPQGSPRHPARRTGHLTGIVLVLIATSTSVSGAQQPPSRPRPTGVTTQRPASGVVTQPTTTATAAQSRLMPRLIDSTELVARSMISRMKLVPPVVTERPVDDPRRDGIVVDQWPTPRSVLNRSDTVRFTVDRYVPRTTVSVPAVVDSALLVAIRMIRNAGLTAAPPRLRRDEVGRAVVDSQFPRRGTQLDAGSRVRLTVSIRTIVPRVTGLHVTQAATIISDSGLMISHRGDEYSDSLGAGYVLRQHPDPGTRSQPGAQVDVWISLGPHQPVPSRRMPRLVGLTVSAATDSIRFYRLRLAHVDSIENAPRAGLVTQQTPGARTVIHEGDAVDLEVAIAPKPKRVPWTVGMRRDDATRLLADSGFAVRVTIVPDSLRGDDRVISQSPDSGVPRRPVTDVTIEVVDSIGPARSVSVEMPSVMGMSREQAADTLGFLSPRLSVYERPITAQSDSGLVIEQYPLPGALVLAGLEASITLGRYERQDTGGFPPPVRRTVVPELRNRPIGQARVLLDLATLRLGHVEASVSVAPESVVVSQQPDSGANVELGTPVSVTLRASAQSSDDPIRRPIPWFWLVVLPGGALLLYVAWQLWHKTPPDVSEPGKDPPPPSQIHARLVQRPFQPPTLARKESDSVVAFAFVHREPEVDIKKQGSLIQEVR